MSADEPTQADFAYRAEALLKSMEPQFLAILAEHEGSVPKGDGGESAAVSPSSEAGGADEESCGEHTTAEIVLSLCEGEADNLLNSLVRWHCMGDIDSLREVVGFAERVILSVMNEGIENHGWSED